jgi:hypothetical protein
MKKRHFLSAAALGSLSLSGAAQAARPPGKPAAGPGLLTVTGAIGRGTRGAIDPALDQMMLKQKLRFDKAHVFDFAALSALPAVTIRPTVEYDSQPHTLSGPLLGDVVRATGAAGVEGTRLLLRAVDGYAVLLGLADARRYRTIVATHMDGAPLALGGLGPLWAVYDADRFPEMAARPVNERFALCPWGLYHIEVQVA